MAIEQTVQAFNDLREIYLNSVAPEFITEAKKPLIGNQWKLDVDKDGDIEADDLRDLRRGKKTSLERAFNKSDTPNSEESVKNVERHRKVLAGQRCESYSNWREELPEILEALEGDNDRTVDVSSKVNNYKKGDKGKPVVEINPSMKEAFEGYDVEVIDSQELDESYLQEAVDVAAEYFYESGLNEYGVEEVIELLGEDKFNDFVFDLVEDYQLNEENLLEWRRGPSGSKIRGSQVDKKGRQIKDLPVKGGVKTKAIKATPEHQARAAAKEAEKEAKDNPSEREKHFKELSARQKALRSASASKAIETAKEKPQNVAKSSSPTTKQLIGRTIAGAIGSGVRATADLAARGILSAGKGVEAAKQTKGSALQKAGAGIAAAVKAHHKKGTAHLEAYDQLQEKAESQSQQQLFGIALSVKRGETPRSQVSKAVLDIVDSMSEAEIRKFAKTKHKGLPQHVKEELLVSKVLRIVRESRDA